MRDADVEVPGVSRQQGQHAGGDCELQVDVPHVTQAQLEGARGLRRVCSGQHQIAAREGGNRLHVRRVAAARPLDATRVDPTIRRAMLVLLGDADNDPNHYQLPKEPGAMKQAVDVLQDLFLLLLLYCQKIFIILY